MRPRALPLLALAGLLLLADGARAAVGDGLHPPEPVRLMIFGPGSDDAARGEAEKLRLRMERRVTPPRSVVPATELFPATADETLRAYGDILVTACPGEPTPPDAVLEAIDRGMLQFADMEYPAAIDAFVTAEAMLPCLTGFLPEGKLGDLAFFHGLAEFYVHGPTAAREVFARTLSANPTRPWDDRFPPPPQQAFLDASKDVLHSPPTALLLRDPTGTIQEIRVDTTSWSGFPDAPRELVPGTHLIQWRDVSGSVHSLQIELVPGGQLVLLTGAGFLHAVLDGGRDPDLGRVVAPRLRQAAVDHGAEQVIVVRAGEDPQVSLFDPASGDFQLTERERSRSRTEEERALWGPRGGLSIGGGFISLIAPRDEWDFQYGTIIAVGEFRVIAGLYMDVAISLGLRRGEVDRYSAVLLPMSRIGVKYAFKFSVIRPYLGIVGQTTVYGDDNVALGGGGIVGLALDLPRRPELRLGFEVYGGNVVNWQVMVTGQIGVYY
jgi:hypothetical protein